MSVDTVQKPWGHELIWARSPAGYVGKILFVKKGLSLSKQYHKHKDETMLVLSGHVVLELGGSPQRDMRPRETVHVPPGTVHRLTAIEDSEVLEVSTSQLDDVVRIEDDYGRV